MSFKKFDSYYLRSDTSLRLIRYDIINLDEDTYVVKVFDEIKEDKGLPYRVNIIDEFTLKRADYITKYGIGDRSTIKMHMPPTFESSIDTEVQEHRNRLG